MPQLYGERHPSHKLTAEDVLAIREAYQPGVVTLAELATRFGVSKQTISVVLSGKTWKHVEDIEQEAGDSYPGTMTTHGVRTLSGYQQWLSSEGGKVLQLNEIGALTLLTAYWKLGQFETLIWDARRPDSRESGITLAALPTLEYATAFHYECARLLWKSAFGSEARKRAKWFDDMPDLIGDIKSGAIHGLADVSD